MIQPSEPVTPRNAPAIVKAAGKGAEFAWEEFFQAEIANAHTRKNYMHAVRQFPALGIGAVVELADQLDRTFEGMNAAVSMVADIHHVPAVVAIAVEDVKFPECEIRIHGPS